jgi:ribokinase
VVRQEQSARSAVQRWDQRPRVVVVGSINRDYVFQVDKRPKPGQTVLADDAFVTTGGKGANQAVAAARVDADVHLVARVGDDADGRATIHDLSLEGVDCSAVSVDAQVSTGQAFVLVTPDGENSIVLAPEANSRLPADSTRMLVEQLLHPDAVVVSQAEIPSVVLEQVAAAAARAGVRFVFNLAPYRPLPAALLQSCDPLVLNETEASELFGDQVFDVTSALDALKRFRDIAQSVVITLGAKGAVVVENGSATHVASAAVDVVDTTGAGDAFVGVLAAQLARGNDLTSAVRAGVAAGTHTVQQRGAQTSYPRLRDLDHPSSPHELPSEAI